MKRVRNTIPLLLFLLFATAEKAENYENLHFPPPEIPTFIREAVEKPPEKPSDHKTSGLPLRDAVEKHPLITDELEEINPQLQSYWGSKRIPLRDAVEKQTFPEENWRSLELFTSNSVQESLGPDFQELDEGSGDESEDFVKDRSLKVFENDEKIVCYIQAAAAYRRKPLTFTPKDLDPFACTHVIYAFASIDPHDFKLISNDDEYDIVQGGYKSVLGLKLINPELKVLISVGEGRDDSHRFSNLVSSADLRTSFIKSVVKFIEEYGFDGIDIYWQYPGAGDCGGKLADKDNFSFLLEEMSEKFKPKFWILSVSVPGLRFRIEEGYKPFSLRNFVDFINLQTYDFHHDRESIADHHSNLKSRSQDQGLDLFLNVEYSVKFWLRKGFPRSKILVGIPFYGRSFTLKHTNVTEVKAPIKGPGQEGFYTQKPGFLAYFEICELINDGWEQRRDEAGSAFLVQGDQWIGYDDSDSLKEKIAYVKRMRLGGVFVWSADLDDFKGFCGKTWPLLSTIRRLLKKQAISDVGQPSGVCRTDETFSDPDNCNFYYICQNGLKYHLSCGEGRMFDPSLGRCDFIAEEKCKQGETVHFSAGFKDKSVIQDKSDLKVVCFVTNWAFYRKTEGKFVPEHIDRRLCTHVVYAFASLDPDKLMIKEFDPWVDLDNNLYERITSLKDIKVLLSLGGWTDSVGSKYSQLANDSKARKRFVVGVVSFLKRYNFDGLHFDWTYPVCWQSDCQKGPASDKPNFTKLIQELRSEFDKEDSKLLLAAAISGYKEVIDVAYSLPDLGKVLDFMSVMSYDYHGPWEMQTGHVSPLYSKEEDKFPQYNTNFTMEYLASLGAPRDKLLVGIPFYGQSFTLFETGFYHEGVPTIGPGESGPFTNQPGMLAYYEICDKIKQSDWTKQAGPIAHNKDQWVSYDDVESVRLKADYVKARGFGGVVAWTIDLDDFSNRCCGGSFPLLTSLNRGLGLIEDKQFREDCTKPPEPITPVAPETTTASDSGASGRWDNKTTIWWVQSSTELNQWWPTSSTTNKWWSPNRSWRTTSSSTTVLPETTKTCVPGEYLPDPSNCQAFFRCTLGELNREFCAGGLHWNKKTNTCDWSYVAKCEMSSTAKAVQTTPFTTKSIPSSKTTFSFSTTPTTSRTTRFASRHTPFKTRGTFFTTKTTPITKITTTTISTTLGTPSTTAIMASQIFEECENGESYPHESCSNFYTCEEGEMIPQTCAPGLNWNDDRKICDWEYSVNCNGRKELAEKYTKSKLHKDERLQPYSTCEKFFSPYPGDCTRYLHCLWGKYEVLECAPGLHWNTARNTCDWPKSAQCNTNETKFDTFQIYQPTSTERGSTSKWYQEWTPTTKTYWYHTYRPFNQPVKTTKYKIVCYFTNWAWYREGLGKYLPEDIDPELCTHIVYGFAVLDYTNLVIKAHDTWTDFENNFYERVTAFKLRGVKILLAIGGWNDSGGDKYSRLVHDPVSRSKFIRHVVDFLDKYNFDGLDFDWEYPKCWQVKCKRGPDSDKEAFVALIKELSSVFKSRKYLLTAAVSPNKIVVDVGYDVPTLSKYFDWIAVMCYDYHGSWDKFTGHVAPFYHYPEAKYDYYNSNFSIHYWLENGAPPSKLIMGMPLYGRSFTLEKATKNGLNATSYGPGEAGEFTRAGGFLAFYEICERVKRRGWQVIRDAKGRIGPYATLGHQWVSYDDMNDIRKKAKFVKDLGLGGAMVWALDLDDFRNRCGCGRHPLLKTLNNELLGTSLDISVQNCT